MGGEQHGYVVVSRLLTIDAAHYISTATLANFQKRVEEVEAATSPQEQLKVLRSELNKRKVEYEVRIPTALLKYFFTNTCDPASAEGATVVDGAIQKRHRGTSEHDPPAS